MEAFFRTLSSGNNVIIIPKVNIEQDGHPILVFGYAIFQVAEGPFEEQLVEKAALSEDAKARDPDYVGELTFEIPDKLFSYDFQDDKDLSTEDEREIISLLTDIRENSGLWNFYNENNPEQTD